jgi:hypothetical protein
MKLLFGICLTAILGLASAAQAVVNVEVIWASTTGSGIVGGSSINAHPGDQLVAHIRVTPDAGGVAGQGSSIQFDVDLGDELNLLGVTELLPPGMEFNLNPGVESTQESTEGQLGNVLSFESVAVSINGPAAGSYVAAEVTFEVTANVVTDGADVFVGEFNDIDAMIDNGNAIITPAYGSASVDLAGSGVPALSAPSVVVASLLLALAAVAVIRRRRAAEA